MRPPLVYANFVSSLDGVTAVDPAAPGQGRLISGGAPADRFLMGLLRAFADVVLIGAGTLRAESDHLWTADRVYPPAADAFAELRRRLGRAPRVPLAVVTRGDLDPALPALAGGTILTTSAGAARLRPRAPAGVSVVPLGEGPLAPAAAAIGALRAAGHSAILTEGGPHLFGELLAANLVDELFLTLSPVLAGQERGGRQIGMVEGVSLLPGAPPATLLDARRAESHLFLRYRLRS